VLENHSAEQIRAEAPTTKRANFARFTVNARTLSADVAHGDLPNVGPLIPDQCHNAHDECRDIASSQIKQADDWISDQVRVLQSGPDWKARHLLIVVTADEDNKEGANDIEMIAIHPSLSHYSTDVPSTCSPSEACSLTSVTHLGSGSSRPHPASPTRSSSPSLLIETRHQE
jgi:hypothetical protein